MLGGGHGQGAAPAMCFLSGYGSSSGRKVSPTRKALRGAVGLLRLSQLPLELILTCPGAFPDLCCVPSRPRSVNTDPPPTCHVG